MYNETSQMDECSSTAQVKINFYDVDDFVRLKLTGIKILMKITYQEHRGSQFDSS